MIERSVMASPERCETVMDHQPPPPLSHVLKLLYWRVRRDKRTTPHVAAVLFRFGRSFLTLWLGKYVGRARTPIDRARARRRREVIPRKIGTQAPLCTVSGFQRSRNL